MQRARVDSPYSSPEEGIFDAVSVGEVELVGLVGLHEPVPFGDGDLNSFLWFREWLGGLVTPCTAWDTGGGR